MTKQPLFLNLLKIRLPITAKASITHRIAAVGVFFLIFPFMGAVLIAVSSPDGFSYIQELGNSIFVKTLLNLFIAGLTYHYIAGLRHLIMDFFHIGESLNGSHYSSIFTIVLWIGTSLVFFGYLFI